MIHLITARKARPSPGAVFLAGSVAPDAVGGTWKNKDFYHFRDLDRAAREEALRSLAAATDPRDCFAEGSLLHLYVDYKWDTAMRDPFIAKHGENWYPPYKTEIVNSSCYARHNTPDGARLWEKLLSCKPEDYGNIPGATGEELRAFIERNKRWYDENKTPPSAVFTPEIVECFTDEAAREYLKIRN